MSERLELHLSTRYICEYGSENKWLLFSRCFKSPVVTICTTRVNIHKSAFCLRIEFVCSVWISVQTAIISLHTALTD